MTDDATLQALREALRVSSDNVPLRRHIGDLLARYGRHGEAQPLTTKDLLAAAKQVKPSTTEWFSTARNYALYSNPGGAYDNILEYLKLK